MSSPAAGVMLIAVTGVVQVTSPSLLRPAIEEGGGQPALSLRWYSAGVRPPSFSASAAFVAVSAFVAVVAFVASVAFVAVVAVVAVIAFVAVAAFVAVSALPA